MWSWPAPGVVHVRVGPIHVSFLYPDVKSWGTHVLSSPRLEGKPLCQTEASCVPVVGRSCQVPDKAKLQCEGSFIGLNVSSEYSYSPLIAINLAGTINMPASIASIEACRRICGDGHLLAPEPSRTPPRQPHQERDNSDDTYLPEQREPPGAPISLKMSMTQPMRIVLDNAPPFYTNLDNVAGRVVLLLQRTEQIAGIVVKLEGEARTIAYDDGTGGGGIEENHKILYQVEQVFPRPGSRAAHGRPSLCALGPHEFPFRLKLPFNNVCWDIQTMAKMGGGFLGGGVRVMDGSKQMLLHHAKRTLPPSFVAWPKKAEVRYYIKVTVQRPGLLNPNWRHQIDFRFMPIEEPRPENSEAKAYAKRPFTFKPKAPAAISSGKSLFGKGKHEAPEDVTPPSVEMCAWFPHPTILTCNKPVPLRLVATKKAASSQPVFLTSIAIELTGKTEVRCYENVTPILNRFRHPLEHEAPHPAHQVPERPRRHRVPGPRRPLADRAAAEYHLALLPHLQHHAHVPARAQAGRELGDAHDQGYVLE